MVWWLVQSPSTKLGDCLNPVRGLLCSAYMFSHCLSGLSLGNLTPIHVGLDWL